MKTPLGSLARLGLCALSMLVSVFTSSAATLTPLIESGDTWKYLDNGTNQGTAWKAVAFNDAAWSSGQSSFGYKVDTAVTPNTWTSNGATTKLNFSAGNNQPSAKYITTYFRKSFTLSSPAFTSLILGMRWDDGYVIYVNGTEIKRENLPTKVSLDPVLYTTPASSAINVLAGFTYFNVDLLTVNPFVTGANVVSVELHQQAPTSSDVFFDMIMTGSTSPPCFGEATIGAYQDFQGDFDSPTADHKTFLRGIGQTQMQYDFEYHDISATQTGYNTPQLYGSFYGSDNRQLQFKRNTSFTFFTERLDAQNFENIQASLQLRTENDKTASLVLPWGSDDYIKGSIQVSSDGVGFTDIPWFKYQASPTSTVLRTLVEDTAADFWQVPAIAAVPPAASVVTNATNATPIVITTAAANTFVTGDYVTIAGVLGNTAANGTFPVTVVNSTSFSLTGSVGNGVSTFTVTGATNANPIVITTSVAHPFVTGNSVIVRNVAGNTAANGTFTITKLTATTFSLTGAVGNGTFTGTAGTVGGNASATRAVGVNNRYNPSDWFAFKPTLWPSFNTAPVQGTQSANFWRAGNLTATTVKGGIGYDNNVAGVDYTPFLDAGSSPTVKTDMFNKESRVNIRIPFTVPNDVTINAITKVELWMRFDDAFGAWLASDLNATSRAGVKLAGEGEPASDTAVPAGRDDATSIIYKAYDITTLFKANAMSGLNNVLCIRGYNAGISSSDLLMQSKIIISAPNPAPDPNSPAVLELTNPPPNTQMTTLTTPLGLIPNGIRTMRIKLEGNIVGDPSENDYQYCYFDNLITRGDAKSAKDLGSTLAVQLPPALYTFEQRQPLADPDGDGIQNLLEYAFGGHAAQANRFTVLPTLETVSLLPQITSTAGGYITMQFRILAGQVEPSDMNNFGYLTVNDLRYVPEGTANPQGVNGESDWRNSQFTLVGNIENNEDGTQLVTIRSKVQYIATANSGTTTPRFSFRVRVDSLRDPWLNPPGSACPFPE